MPKPTPINTSLQCDNPTLPAVRVLPVRATVQGWRDISGMSRTGTFEALARGDLNAVKLGSKTLIDVAHGLAWLDSLPPARTHKQAA